LLIELLAKHTKMKVIEVEHESEIQGGCVYVIPPRKHMTLVGDRIQLTDKDAAERSPNTAVDTFFIHWRMRMKIKPELWC